MLSFVACIKRDWLEYGLTAHFDVNVHVCGAQQETLGLFGRVCFPGV